MANLDPGVTGRRQPGAARKQPRPRKARAPLTKAATTTNAATAAEKQPKRRTHDPPAGSPFMSIPAAGKKFFGLSKNGSYDAAKRGDFGKLYEVGRRKFVVVPALEARIRAAAEAEQREAAE
jgi:hypothetical protein